MPPNACVDEVGTCLLCDLGQTLDLSPIRASGHQVQHAQSVHHQEIWAHRLANPCQNFLRKAASPFKIAAPFVVAKVGVCHEKLIDEVSLRPHDFHAVVSRLSGKHRRPHKGTDGALHSPSIQGPWFEPGNRRFQRRGRHTKRGVRVATCVKDLHGNLASSFVYGTRNDLVFTHMGRR